MIIEETSTNGITVALITGRIDGATASSCETSLLGIIQNKNQPMILDLGGVDYLSSAGIRVLFLAFKRATALKLPLVLARPQEHVREILSIAGLTDILVAHPSVDAAIQAIGG